MRLWFTSVVGVALLFSGAVTAALGQSASGDISAQVSAAEPALAPSAAVNAEVQGEYSGYGGSRRASLASSVHEAGSVSAHKVQFRRSELATYVRQAEAAGFTTKQGALRNLRSRFSSKRSLQSVVPPVSRGRGSVALTAACSGIFASAGGRSAVCQHLGVRVGSPAFYADYAGGFPDSTRGTALLSPPDTGTSSPLDWSPGEVSGGGLNFMPSSFLNPSLHVSASAKSKRRRLRNQRKKPEQPGLSPLQNPLLQGNTLGQPSLEPDLGSSGSQSTSLGGLLSPLGTNNELGDSLNQQ